MHDTTPHPGDRRRTARPTSTRPRAATFVVAAVVAAAGIVVAGRGVSTSSAEISASTRSLGVFRAGVVAIQRPDESVALILDADGLYPGREASGCSVIEYGGTVPAALRLSGDRSGGTGLDEFVQLRIRLLDGANCVDGVVSGEPSSSVQLFAGRLGELWTEHGSFDDGVQVADVQPGASIVVEAIASVADDNRAQGLTTRFALMFEARPT